MITKRNLEDINDEVISLSKKLGWEGEVTVQAADFPTDGTVQSSSAWYPDKIDIGVSANLDEESALKRAKAQFIHAVSHDPQYTRIGAELSHPVEEAMTYIRGSAIASEMGVSNEFDALGKCRISELMAEALAKSRGEEVTDEDKNKAKVYIERFGMKKAVVKLKELIPYGEYPLGYEGERLKMLKSRATSVFVPTLNSAKKAFRIKRKPKHEDTLIESKGE